MDHLSNAVEQLNRVEWFNCRMVSNGQMVERCQIVKWITRRMVLNGRLVSNDQIIQLSNGVE